MTRPSALGTGELRERPLTSADEYFIRARPAAARTEEALLRSPAAPRSDDVGVCAFKRLHTFVGTGPH